MDLNKYFAGGFEKRQKPAQFFTNLCKPVHVLEGVVKFDKRDVLPLISVNVQSGTGGRYHDLDAFESLEYEIPDYNDCSKLRENFFKKRSFGQHEYASKVVSVVDKITRDQAILSEWQRNTQEKQVVDVLLTGKIQLINGDKIDYKKKESHNIAASAKYSSTGGKPLSDVEKAIQVIIDDGKPATTDFHYIMNSSDINDFILNDQVQKAARKLEGIDLVSIGMPPEKTLISAPRGKFSTGGCNVYLWGINTKYRIPAGFGFAGEGTEQFFLPKGKSVVIPANPQFTMYYGGLIPCAPDMDPLGMEPQKAEQLAYQYKVCEDGCNTIVYGVKTAPLFVPENGDDYASIEGIS